MNAAAVSISPRKPAIPSEVIAMALFLFAEMMFFAGIISAYLVLRIQVAEWPPAGQPRFPALATAFNTLLLVASGYTMWKSAVVIEARKVASYKRLLAVSLTLGSAFLVLQGYEWLELIGYGLTTTGNIYGALFYVVIGSHALHVAFALIFLALAVARIRRSPDARIQNDGAARALRLYWFFVVGIWPPLYGLVYLW